MFNSSLDAYGAIRRPVTVAGQGAAPGSVAPKAVEKVESAKVESRQTAEVDKAALTNAVKKLNELVAPALQSVQFSMDEEAGRVIVKVVDTATQKVLRQIPNEEVLAFSKTLGRLQGLVVRESA